MRKIYLFGASLFMMAGASFGQYCVSGGPTSTIDTNVEGVSLLGDATNISYTGCPGVLGVEDQTAQVADLTAGSSYSVDVTWGTCSGTYYGMSAEIWIDFDGSQTFDPGESIGTDSYGFGGGPLASTYNFTVPATALNGTHRMRVMQLEGSGVLDPCQSMGYGSVTDFSVTISGGTSCLPPTALTQANPTTSSVELSWTENGGSTSWDIEYGTTGFTPGTGTNVVAGSNVSYLLSGLTINTVYDIYVRSICGPGDTSSYVGPITMNTYDVAPYTFMETDLMCPTGGFMDIASTGTAYDISDDGEQNVAMTFPFIFQGTLVSDLRIGNNGGLLIGTTTGNVNTSGTIAPGTNAAYPWWDDLDSETGDVYYEELGTAPNRVAVVQWETICNYSGFIGAPTVTFQVQIHESTNEIFFVYEDVEFGGGNVGDDFAANADIGLSGPNQTFVLSDDDPAFLMSTLCARFYYPTCPKVSNITSTYSATDSLEVGWTSNGTETSWVIEYGPTGFTPGSGTTVSTTSNPDTLGGLIDNTMYDFYVYADCGSGDTSSAAGPATFTTDIVCAAPTGFGFTYTSNDTAAYTWTPGGLESSWNIEFGPTGFIPGTGAGTATTVGNNPDTTFNLPGGGVYDFYIQADCGAGLNNPWTGPITYATPIVNDSTCDAVVVPVDGSTTTYSNFGATTQIGSSTLGFNTVWFSFVAPASGHVEIRTCGNSFDNYLEVYETTDCSDISVFALVNDATGNPFASCSGSFDPAGINLCGLTSGNTYYLAIGSETDGNTGTFPLTLTELPAIDAGTAVPTDVCEDNAAFDLFTTISGNLTTTGQWYNPSAAPGSEFSNLINVVGAPAGVYTFDYVQTEICGADTVSTSITVVELPNVGMGSTIDAGCNYNSVSLADGLSGTIDFGGTWYDESGTMLSSSLVTYNMDPAGSYDYYYVVDNGVCAADSATVTVTVTDCAGVEENTIVMSVYPNPVQDNLTINLANVDANAVVELFTVQGQSVMAPTAMNNSTINVDMSGVADGVYILKVTANGSAEEVRVVKK